MLCAAACSPSALPCLVVPLTVQKPAVVSRCEGIDEADHAARGFLRGHRGTGASHVRADPAGIEQHRGDAPAFGISCQRTHEHVEGSLAGAIIIWEAAAVPRHRAISRGNIDDLGVLSGFQQAQTLLGYEQWSDGIDP